MFFLENLNYKKFENMVDWNNINNLHQLLRDYNEFVLFRFDGITNAEDLVNFFEEYFADSIPLIGKEKMIEDYFNTRPLPLISIKVVFLTRLAHNGLKYFLKENSCFHTHVFSRSIHEGVHSMVTANLKKSEDFVTNITAASKYIPRRPKIPPFRRFLWSK